MRLSSSLSMLCKRLYTNFCWFTNWLIDWLIISHETDFEWDFSNRILRASLRLSRHALQDWTHFLSSAEIPNRGIHMYSARGPHTSQRPNCLICARFQLARCMVRAPQAATDSVFRHILWKSRTGIPPPLSPPTDQFASTKKKRRRPRVTRIYHAIACPCRAQRCIGEDRFILLLGR